MQRVLLLLLLPRAACLVLPGPLRQVYYDWVALNARSTTRHIMKPLTTAGREELLLLKQQVRADVTAGSFVVDAFASAATVSIDEESCQNGGLIGRRLRQGVCILPELDRACFTAPLGEVAGPLRSSEGYHLVLVEERLQALRFSLSELLEAFLRSFDFVLEVFVSSTRRRFRGANALGA